MKSSSSTPLLSISGVSRRYGVAPRDVIAIDNVDFHVQPGELVAIMGPSGSGKSTLLTIAGGLDGPTAGTVLLDNRPLHDLSQADLAEVRRRCIGFVFQGFNLLYGLTAAENVAAPLELDGVHPDLARTEAIGQLEAVGLGDRADTFPDDLSGGERQRVAIARGLIGDRQLLLADEPTGALDSTTSAVIMGLLRSACTPDPAVVVVTHAAEVAAWADRVVLLKDGRVESTYRPGHPERSQQ